MENYWAAWAPNEFVPQFQRELDFRGLRPVRQAGDFFLFGGAFVEIGWAACQWKNVELLKAESIGAAGKALKPKARVWRHVSCGQHRRGELLLEQLRPSKLKTQIFPHPAPAVEGLGAFTWLNKEELAWSREFDRPDPSGAMPFEEDRKAPSRAYLKLWEAFTIRNQFPKDGDRCVDLGACPGGWTYVTHSLGAHTLSIDRSPLDPALMASPRVEFRSADAFQYLPDKNDPVDWLLSDVICYPAKLYPLVEAWVRSGKAKHLVITIKFQGEANPADIAKFQELGRVLHLAHNKHELTFLYEREDLRAPGV